MAKLMFAFFIAVFALKANAYFIASNNKEINPSTPTHILVAGAPEEVDELFVESLLTQAQVIRERLPEDQIIIIGRNDDRKLILDRGYKLIEKTREQLKDQAIEKIVRKLKLIKSLDIYAHSNPVSGVLLDRGTFVDQILNEKNDFWDLMTGKLSGESYFNFHGCNAGLKMAPIVAKKLKVAVFAALTGTDFQTIYKDSYWAHDQNAKKSERSTSNTLSLNVEKSCAAGFCRRMKPDNHTYKGYWGDWLEGGYPTYKIFCGSNDNPQCGRGVVEGLLNFPSVTSPTKITSLEDFKPIAYDFLCPFAHDQLKQQKCIEGLESSLTGTNTKYSPFNGVTLNCDFTKCEAHFNCSNSSSRSCHLVNEKPGENETFTNEYKFILKSFEESLKGLN